MSDGNDGLSKEKLRAMYDRAKLTSMRDLYLRNHPEWLERAKTEPFPPEMEQEWIEWRKKKYEENGGDDAIDFLEALLSEDDE